MIYVASSWRNKIYPEIVDALHEHGQELYDFRNPGPDARGFSWSEIDPNWQDWTSREYAAALKHPIAQQGYQSDLSALQNCDTCVLVLPAGRSASWEFGFAMGQGKRGIVFHPDGEEPELMFSDAEVVGTVPELLALLPVAAG